MIVFSDDTQIGIVIFGTYLYSFAFKLQQY